MIVTYKGEFNMIRILLCCGGGFSSSAMAKHMQDEIIAQHMEDEVAPDKTGAAGDNDFLHRVIHQIYQKMVYIDIQNHLLHYNLILNKILVCIFLF